MRAEYAVFFYGAGLLCWLLAAFEQRVPIARRLGVNLVALGLFVFFLPSAIATLKVALNIGPGGLL